MRFRSLLQLCHGLAWHCSTARIGPLPHSAWCSPLCPCNVCMSVLLTVSLDTTLLAAGSLLSIPNPHTSTTMSNFRKPPSGGCKINWLSLNSCSPYTEIFSKRRKIYAVCVESLRMAVIEYLVFMFAQSLLFIWWENSICLGSREIFAILVIWRKQTI